MGRATGTEPHWWEGHGVNEPLRRLHARVDVLSAIDIERERQEVKHGDNAIASPSINDLERLAILVEEVGEVAHLLTYDGEGTEEKLMTELVQVAAVAAGWVESRAR